MPALPSSLTPLPSSLARSLIDGSSCFYNPSSLMSEALKRSSSTLPSLHTQTSPITSASSSPLFMALSPSPPPMAPAPIPTSSMVSHPSLLNLKIGSRTHVSRPHPISILKNTLIKIKRRATSFWVFRILGLRAYGGNGFGFWKPDKNAVKGYMSVGDVESVLRRVCVIRGGTPRPHRRVFPNWPRQGHRLIIGTKNLRTPKSFHCSGEWDHVLDMMPQPLALVEIHLERIHLTPLEMLIQEASIGYGG
ncbi:hypothetical protein QJS10_CPB20g00731 [Acorus calamus]|uniref:Uncharacterized protein n=1 Tax=Acorus calamus TaxID=4465 RepID=A0AAV9CB23_ACOCL|nr:hypothetical protein QJS10_CPB20g00731 [Acorus calamus]